MKRLILICLPIVIQLSCTHNTISTSGPGETAKSQQEKNHIEQQITIGKNLKASRYAEIYFSPQPSDEDILELKAQGFTKIINLRRSEEGDYKESSERKAASRAGLAYTHIPTNPKIPITDEFIDKVTSVVKKHRGSGKILIHCSSGNRAGMWAGGHFHKDHNVSKQESLNLAKRLGLTKKPAIENVEAYLKSK
ncbi:MAG: hypothetical protein HRU19_14345 [Pseudobacteriovorax sp.]|nr:hypothetical protein [Pseudobacteriovorax sp.]